MKEKAIAMRRIFATRFRLAACAVAGLCVAIVIGCASGEDATTEPPTRRPPEMPDWILATPSEPGVAFYGVGSGAFKLAEQKPRAIGEADAQARRQIAETMGQKIDALIKTYASGVVTETSQISEESMSEAVIRAFTERCVNPAAIVRLYTSPTPDANGLFYVYALATVDFEAAVAILRDTATRFLVAEGPTRAHYYFGDIGAKLAAAQQEAYPNAKPLAPPIAGEDVSLAAGEASIVALGGAVPVWTFNGPSAPGAAFYGVGRGEITIAGESADALANATTIADAVARAHALTQIEPIVRRLIAARAEAAGFADAKQVATDALAAIRDSCVAGAPIIRRFTTLEPDAAGHRQIFTLVEVELRAVLDALLSAVLHSPADAGNRERIRAAFANVESAAIIEHRYHADPNAGPVPPPIAGEIVVATAITE